MPGTVSPYSQTQTRLSLVCEKGGGGSLRITRTLIWLFHPLAQQRTKVHRQLRDRCDVFHPSYCKTQCIVVIMLMNFDIPSQKESTMKAEVSKAGREMEVHPSPIWNTEEAWEREKDRLIKRSRGQMEKGDFSPWSAGFALTCNNDKTNNSYYQ